MSLETQLKLLHKLAQRLDDGSATDLEQESFDIILESVYEIRKNSTCTSTSKSGPITITELRDNWLRATR